MSISKMQYVKKQKNWLLRPTIIIGILIFNSSVSLNAQQIGPAPEPVSSRSMSHEIVSSSHYQDYRFQDPFRIARVNDQGDHFSIDQEKKEIHFLLEAAGPTQSRTKDLYMFVEGLHDYKIELQRGRQSRKETISQTASIEMPSNSIFSAVVSLSGLPVASGPVPAKAYYLGRNTWRGESFITITYFGEVEENVLLTLIAKNPDDLSNTIEELGRFMFSAPVAILHLLGESVYNHMSFVNYLISFPEIESPTIMDIDGNIYETVIIGDQIWMAENLRVKHYRNGDKIQYISPANDDNWTTMENGAYTVYPHNAERGLTTMFDSNEKIVEIYGKLYNWFAVNDNRGLCPSDWRIPSNEDWNKLATFLGGEEQNYGGKIRTKGSDYWQAPNLNTTNESGFSALPGGLRDSRNGTFYRLGIMGTWWVSDFTTREDHHGIHKYTTGRWLYHGNTDDGRRLINHGAKKQTGQSVRCIKD